MCRREEEKSPRQDEGAGVTPDYTTTRGESTETNGETVGVGSVAKPTYRADADKLLKLPDWIKAHPYFCLWKWEWDKKREEWTKVPYDPSNGRYAESDNSSTFSTLEKTLDVYSRGGYDGIGIGLFDGFSGIDVDHHMNDGELDETARDIADRMGAYTETSPSGDGIHMLFYCPDFASKSDRESYMESYYFNNRKVHVETYVSGMTNRFLTITGDTLSEGTNDDKSEGLAFVLDKYMRKSKPKNTTTSTTAAKPIDIDDDELVSKAKASKNGGKFSSLWDGITSGYGSVSEADQALCNMLAFWTGKDAERMDRLFRSSGLYREKWDEMRGAQTYGQMTISKAIEGTTEVYDPHRGGVREIDVDVWRDWDGSPIEQGGPRWEDYDNTELHMDGSVVVDDDPEGEEDGDDENDDEEVVKANATIIQKPEDGTLYVLVGKDGNRISAPVWHVVKSINRHPLLKNISYDEFQHSVVTCGPLPWDRYTDGRVWTPIDDKRLYSLLEGQINAKSRDNVRDGLAIAADNNRFDSLKDMMLNGLPQWDGTPRVERMLQDLLGVEDSEYVRRTWRVFMNGAFMRAVQPGCKMELMPVIESLQGGEKTQFCTILAIRDDWYLDGPSKLSDVADSARSMYGKFVCEQGELRSFRNADWESIKSFLSRSADKFVDKWEKTPTSIPRRTVLIGTTNRKDFLRDCTGARRFLPYHAGVRRPLFDLYGSEAKKYVMQCWAETARAYKRGKRLLTYLTPELESLAEPHRAQYSAVDDTASAIIGWVESLDEWIKPPTRICGLAVANKALGISTEDFHKNSMLKAKIAETLDHSCSGWVRNPKRQRCELDGKNYGVQTVWERRR